MKRKYFLINARNERNEPIQLKDSLFGTTKIVNTQKWTAIPGELLKKMLAK